MKRWGFLVGLVAVVIGGWLLTRSRVKEPPRSEASSEPQLGEHEGPIGLAWQKAEIKLLGGLDMWNRYYRLKGASMTGHLDHVDDDGEWKHKGPLGKGIGGEPHPSTMPPPPDTSEFDHYFAN